MILPFSLLCFWPKACAVQDVFIELRYLILMLSIMVVMYQKGLLRVFIQYRELYISTATAAFDSCITGPF